MPLWALRLRDFDILNIYYDEFKIEKMVKFETLIVPRGLVLNDWKYFLHILQMILKTDFSQ